VENFSEAMKISDIMKKILAPDPTNKEEEAALGFVGTCNQTEAADRLEITQSRVSDWKAGKAEIEKAWQAFMRLFTYCERELGFDPREELKKRQGRKTKWKLNNPNRKPVAS